MITDFNFQLKNVGLINNANIKLSKINVICGDNSTGKSTSSKILYSFLRSNSKTRKELTKNTLIDNVLDLTSDMNRFYMYSRDDSENKIPLSNDIRTIYNEIRRKEFDDEDIDIINYYRQIIEIFNDYQLRYTSTNIFDKPISNINRLITIYEEEGEDLFNSIMNLIIRSEFGKTVLKNNEVSFSGKFNKIPFEYTGHLMNSGMKTEGGLIIEEVFYLESLSNFDLFSRGGSQNTEHVNHVFNCIKSDYSKVWADEITNEEIIKIEEKLFEITCGSFVYDDGNIIYNDEFLMKNTASGIKQIGLIQMLLNNRQLKENSFLIIDEPEVNLHPKWQIKFAEILVLLARDLNITSYCNTHSPLFIEAIRTYSEQQDLLDETNFYLTYESKEFQNKYDIKYISNENLSIIYNSLGKPYETLSEISIENQFK